MELNDYDEMIKSLTSVADANRLSQLLEEDSRRFDRSFSDEREAGRI